MAFNLDCNDTASYDEKLMSKSRFAKIILDEV